VSQAGLEFADVESLNIPVNCKLRMLNNNNNKPEFNRNLTIASFWLLSFAAK